MKEVASSYWCRTNNLKQIGLAFLNYESSHGRFPAAWKLLPKLFVKWPDHFTVTVPLISLP
ncbi:MAG TPA: DUF1559 domain-containing protein [Gemmataceae bacterium]|nr:DUF1559 domain-containing protein [Gemmataceae bacterium]